MSMSVMFNVQYYDAQAKRKYRLGERAFIQRALGRKLVTANVVEIIPAQRLREEQASKAAAERETAVVKPVVEKPDPPVVEEVEVGESEAEVEETAQCEGETASGERCKAIPKDGDVYCWRHETKETE